MVNNILAENVMNAATLQMTATTLSVSIVMRSDMLQKPVLTRSFVVYARSHLIELVFVLTLGSVNLLLLGRLLRTLLLDRNTITDRNFSKNYRRKFSVYHNRNNPCPRVTSLLTPPPPSAAAPNPEDSILDCQGLLVPDQLFGDDDDDFDLSPPILFIPLTMLMTIMMMMMI